MPVDTFRAQKADVTTLISPQSSLLTVLLTQEKSVLSSRLSHCSCLTADFSCRFCRLDLVKKESFGWVFKGGDLLEFNFCYPVKLKCTLKYFYFLIQGMSEYLRMQGFEKKREHISFICAAVSNSEVRRLIRMVRRSTETHLSCQIRVCALLASAIFHFLVYRMLSIYPQPCVYPVVSCYCGPAFLFLVPCGCG